MRKFSPAFLKQLKVFGIHLWKEEGGGTKPNFNFHQLSQLSQITDLAFRNALLCSCDMYCPCISDQGV